MSLLPKTADGVPAVALGTVEVVIAVSVAEFASYGVQGVLEFADPPFFIAEPVLQIGVFSFEVVHLAEQSVDFGLAGFMLIVFVVYCYLLSLLVLKSCHSGGPDRSLMSCWAERV